MDSVADTSFKRINSCIEEVYELGNPLGKGAFSVVVNGKHKQSQEEYAVKIIDKRRVQCNKKAEVIVRNEIEILQKIKVAIGNHPNVISLKEVWEDDSRFLIVMELLKGGELFDRIVSKGSYSEKDAATVTKKMVEALNRLHHVGILHRDIKPENLIYTETHDSADIKITDFGLGLLYQSSTSHPNIVVGTPNYLAPEVLTKTTYTPACDIWSMGVVLYILLCGYPPFYGESYTELYREIIRGQLEFDERDWAHISEDAKDLIRKMLHKNHAERINCDMILQHPWIRNSDTQSEVPLTDSYQRLKRFNAKQKFKAAAMACMVGAKFNLRKGLARVVREEGFSEDELFKLKRIFSDVASEKGEIDRESFRNVMHTIGYDDAGSVDLMFDHFDEDSNGAVDYRELLVGLRALRGGGERALKFCFDVYDRNGSGAISKEELGDVLRGNLQEAFADSDSAEHQIDVAERLAALFDELDQNNDGKISFDEFRSGVQKHPYLVSRFLQPTPTPTSSEASRRKRKQRDEDKGEEDDVE